MLLAPCFGTHDGFDVSELSAAKRPGVYGPLAALGIKRSGGATWDADKASFYNSVSDDV